MEATGTIQFEEPVSQFAQVVTTRRIVCAAALLISMALAGLGLSTAQGAPAGWGDDLNRAIETAQESGRPLVVLIASESCDHCARMEANLARSSVRLALSRAVKVRAEATEYPDLTARFAADGTPTILIFDAATGYETPVFTHTGVLGASQLVNLGRML